MSLAGFVRAARQLLAVSLPVLAVGAGMWFALHCAPANMAHHPHDAAGAVTQLSDDLGDTADGDHPACGLGPEPADAGVPGGATPNPVAKAAVVSLPTAGSTQAKAPTGRCVPHPPPAQLLVLRI